jgi:catechol 2,3-dioxygenase-like lactoylglutathione lyase family enzyme
MQIRHVLIKVDDQDKALTFYTDVLGFRKHLDLGVGQARWLTVVSSEGADGVELVLETNSAAPSRAAQKVLYDAKFPAAVLTTKDIAADYDRLIGRGVHFLSEPIDIGPVTTVFFDDTCGNVINLTQPKT